MLGQLCSVEIQASCKVEAVPDAALAAEVFPGGVPQDFRTWIGKGCARCHGTGSYGRVAVAEFLPATSRLRRSIARRLPVDDLRAVARQGGLRPLRDEALALVQEGVIAFGELRDMMPPEFLTPANAAEDAVRDLSLAG
jgi:type II secretory ATPase GspE/PulE/Tfp pilus assembly ATPase PilB-like protein